MCLTHQEGERQEPRASIITTTPQKQIEQAVAEIERMRAWRLSDVPVAADEDEEFRDPAVRATVK